MAMLHCHGFIILLDLLGGVGNVGMVWSPADLCSAQKRVSYWGGIFYVTCVVY
jgi:hypothetical protein